MNSDVVISGLMTAFAQEDHNLHQTFSSSNADASHVPVTNSGGHRKIISPRNTRKSAIACRTIVRSGEGVRVILYP